MVLQECRVRMEPRALSLCVTLCNSYDKFLPHSATNVGVSVKRCDLHRGCFTGFTFNGDVYDCF